ncbi:MAG: response regulator transcription factor [Anaerolineae bacterium]|nr:response regulator transcription factor [Anaerolineae bacterium]
MTLASSILVVDDHPSIQITIGDALKEHGYQVMAVSNGAAALSACKTRHFDLALIDLRMPGSMDGISLLKQLRQNYGHMALIVLTGYATLDSAITALREHASDFLIKPASLDQVLASVERALSHTRAENQRHQIVSQLEQMLHEYGRENGATPMPSLLTNDPSLPRLRLDSKKRVAYRNARTLELTPTEFDLLEFLMQQRDRVVTAHELVRAVHGYDLIESEARPLIRVHIQRLRKKIEDNPDKPQYIQNVRSKGYRFIGED